MYDKTQFLVPGCTRPLDSVLTTFYTSARSFRADADLPEDFQVRWIGGDAQSTAIILQHIRNGDKTGSVTVPEAIKQSGQPVPTVGDTIILIDYDGTPDVLVRITHVEIVAYGHITERHTGLDGPTVRDLEVWKPLHVSYFNMLLAPSNSTCNDATPISFETFELLCTAEDLANV